MRGLIKSLFVVLFCSCLSAAEAAVLPADAELQFVNCDELAAAATTFVEESIASGEDKRRHSVELVTKPREFKAPEGEISFKPMLRYGIRYGSTTAVEVMVKVNGKDFRKVRCSCRVHVFDNVVTAVKNLEPRRVIEQGDVQLEERDVSSVNRKYIADISKVVGREANRIIKSGTIFTKGMIINPVIIESGTQIYVIAVVNGVIVKTEAVALERGREDAVIRVKNVATGKIMRGKVVDATTVQVV